MDVRVGKRAARARGANQRNDDRVGNVEGVDEDALARLGSAVEKLVSVSASRVIRGSMIMGLNDADSRFCANEETFHRGGAESAEENRGKVISPRSPRLRW